MVTGEWHHETVQHIHIASQALDIGGTNTDIHIPAVHMIDRWRELEALDDQVRKQGMQILLQTRFSWRVVDKGVFGTELQVLIGEQPIDCTIGNRQSWTVTQRNEMHTFQRRPQMGALPK